MLLNAAKCQGQSCNRFWVIKEKPTGGKITPSPTQIRVKDCVQSYKRTIIWVQVFKNGPSKICGRQPLKN